MRLKQVVYGSPALARATASENKIYARFLFLYFFIFKSKHFLTYLITDILETFPHDSFSTNRIFDVQISVENPKS